MVIMLVITWRTNSLRYLLRAGSYWNTWGAGLNWGRLAQSCTGWMDCQELSAQLNKRAGLLMSMHRGHPDGVSLLGFLSIPKGKCHWSLHNVSFDSYYSNYNYYMIIAEWHHADDPEFRKFRRHLFHTTLEAILEIFKSVMEEPEVVKCPDGHLRRAVYGLGPYIADYPEQCLLSCIVQGWCPK